MARMGRPGVSGEMKAELWRRWRAGESISVISRQIGKPPGSVFTVLKHHGGIAPGFRKARAGSLTLGEREEISRGLCADQSYRSLAALLGRAVSTFSQDDLDAIATKLNNRPRKCLGFRAPAESA